MWPFKRNKERLNYSHSRRDFLKKTIKTGIGAAITTSPFLSKAAKADIIFTETEKNFSNLDIMDELRKYPELKPVRVGNLLLGDEEKMPPIYYSNSRNSKLFIIVQDEHMGEDEKYGYKPELKQLQIIDDVLKNKFKKDYIIGIEGWAGFDIDKKRGKEIFNGEEEMVRNIIRNLKYSPLLIRTVGLEEENLQIKALSIARLNKLYKLYPTIEYIISKGWLKREDVNKYLWFTYNKFLNYKKGENINTQEDINYLISLGVPREVINQMVIFEGREFPLFKIGIFSIIYDIFYTTSKIEGIKNISDMLAFFNSTYNKNKRKFNQLWKDDIETLPEYFTIIRDEREEYAVKKLLIEMNRKGVNIGVIVFGSNHTEGLKKRFLEYTNRDCDIQIVK